MYNATEQMMDLYNMSLYNTGCIDEINRFSKLCSQFRVDVINSLHTHFLIGFFIISFFIILKIWIEYSRPKFIGSKWYQYAKMRIDFIIIASIIMTIGLMFL